MNEPRVLQITPFMHVPDIDAAVLFFTEILGFDCPFRMSDYAWVALQGHGIRLLQNHGDDGAPPGNRRFAYYVDVDDVDAWYARLKSQLDTLPSRDVHGPEDKPYRQRELLVLAPDGNLIAFGSPMSD